MPWASSTWKKSWRAWSRRRLVAGHPRTLRHRRLLRLSAAHWSMVAVRARARMQSRMCGSQAPSPRLRFCFSLLTSAVSRASSSSSSSSSTFFCSAFFVIVFSFFFSSGCSIFFLFLFLGSTGWTVVLGPKFAVVPTRSRMEEPMRAHVVERVRILATPATPMKRKMRSQISVGTCPNSGTLRCCFVVVDVVKLEGDDAARWAWSSGLAAKKLRRASLGSWATSPIIRRRPSTCPAAARALSRPCASI